MTDTTHPTNGTPAIGRRCVHRPRSRDARWWDRRWEAPRFADLLCRGVVASIATGAVCGALAGLTLGSLSASVTGAAPLVFAIVGAIGGAFLGGPTGLVVAPLVAAVLISTHGTRRRALAAGMTTAVGATTLALLGVLTALPAGPPPITGTVAFLALADLGAVVATRALVVGAVTAASRT